MSSKQLTELTTEQINALRVVLSYMDEDLTEWTKFEKSADKHVVDAVATLHGVKGL